MILTEKPQAGASYCPALPSNSRCLTALDMRHHEWHLDRVKTISITQLHAATARWVRAAAKESFIVTDRGKKVTILERRPSAAPHFGLKGLDVIKSP